MEKGIKITIDYENSLVKLNKLKIAFKDLGTTAKSVSRSIAGALGGDKTNFAGSEKRLRRQIAAMKEVQSSLSKTNTQYRIYQAEIDKVQAKLDKLTDLRKREEKAIKGSAAAIKEEIAALRMEQENRTKSNSGYRKAELQIERLNKELQRLTDTREEHEVVQRGSIASLDQQIQVFRNLQENVATTSVEIEQYQEQIERLEKQKNDLIGSTRGLSRATESYSSSAGIAGSTATEFGRILADLPYGIQGVANNIEQFSQQFVDLSRKAGGFDQAIESLKKTLFYGPAGFVVGVQLITMTIQFVLKAMANLTKETDKLAEAQARSAVALKLLQNALTSSNVSAEERNRLVNNANKEYEGLNLKLNHNNELTLDSKQRLDEMVTSLQKVARARAAVTYAEDLYEKQLKKQIKLRRLETNDFENWFYKEWQYIQDQLAAPLFPDFGRRSRIKTVRAQVESVEDQIKQLIKTLSDNDELDMIFGDASGVKTKAEELKEDWKEFREEVHLSRFEEGVPRLNEELRLLKASALEVAQTHGMASNEMQQLFLDIAKKEHEIRMQQKEDLEDHVAELEEIEPILLKIMPVILGEDLFAEPAQTVASKMAEKRLEATIGSDKFIKEMATKLSKLGAELQKEADDMLPDFPYKLTGIDQKVASLKEKFTIINDLLNAQVEREMVMEQNKTTAMNDQLKARLANEQLSADQRDQINQQIAKNDAALVKKQNELGRKQFERNKAVKILMALGDTYTSAVKAYLSQFMPIPTKKSPVRGAIAAAAATAFGLAQVAAIQRQKYQEKPTKAPRFTGAGGVGGGSPIFNVVGATSQNQLAETISEAQSKPVRAYVVSNEVTTAQGLERNILDGASI